MKYTCLLALTTIVFIGCVQYTHTHTGPEPVTIVEQKIPPDSNFRINGVQYSGKTWEVKSAKVLGKGRFEVTLHNHFSGAETTQIIGAQEFALLP